MRALTPTALVVATITTLLSATPVSAKCETVSVKWNGNYPHNSEKIWSKEYDFGWSRNFLNGTPQENGKVKREGNLPAQLCKTEKEGKQPFIVLMHGCGGMDTTARNWAKDYADYFNKLGYGTLALDSFTPRGVKQACGEENGHWARRRSEDAYSALDYLIQRGDVDPDNVSVIGRSNGGTTTIMIMQVKTGRNHPNKFRMGFAIVPGCGGGKESEEHYAPLIILAAGHDDSSPAAKCLQFVDAPRLRKHPLVKVIVYMDAFHGYTDNVKAHTFNGWRMAYDGYAARDTLKVIGDYLTNGTDGEKDGSVQKFDNELK